MFNSRKALFRHWWKRLFIAGSTINGIVDMTSVHCLIHWSNSSCSRFTCALWRADDFPCLNPPPQNTSDLVSVSIAASNINGKWERHPLIRMFTPAEWNKGVLLILPQRSIASWRTVFQSRSVLTSKHVHSFPGFQVLHPNSYFPS